MICAFVGGNLDGQSRDVPQGTVTWSVAGERYIAIEFRTDKKSPMQKFYMLAGLTPAEAIKRYLQCLSATKNSTS